MFEVGGSTSAVLGTFMLHGGAAIDEARLTVRVVALAENETLGASGSPIERRIVRSEVVDLYCC
jgi:hypothetical protein